MNVIYFVVFNTPVCDCLLQMPLLTRNFASDHSLLSLLDCRLHNEVSPAQNFRQNMPNEIFIFVPVNTSFLRLLWIIENRNSFVSIIINLVTFQAATFCPVLEKSSAYRLKSKSHAWNHFSTPTIYILRLKYMLWL